MGTLAHRVSCAFDRLSTKVADIAGKPVVFMSALAAIITWAICGPLFGFSSTWQLVINTGTTIVTFLMIFLVQHSENKNSAALHVKIDALIEALEDADEKFVGIEDKTDEEVQQLKKEVRNTNGTDESVGRH